MINLKNPKHLKIIAIITFLLVVIGAFLNLNTFVMSAFIGIFVGALVQIFIHKKSS